MLRNVFITSFFLFASMLLEIASAADSASCISSPESAFGGIASLDNDLCQIQKDVKLSCAFKKQNSSEPSELRSNFLKYLNTCTTSASLTPSIATCKKFHELFSSYSSEDLKILKERIADKIAEYDKERLCNGKVKWELKQKKYPGFFPWPKDPKNLSYTDIENKKQALKDVNNTIEQLYGTKEKQIDKMTFCHEPTEDSDKNYMAQMLHPDCVVNVTKEYADNIWETNPNDIILDSKAKQCMEQRRKEGAKVKAVKVFSSSSLLNNTGAACSKCGPQDFSCLSKARAEDAQSNIIPLILNPEEVTALKEAKKISIDYEGSNGDGTSGECPYEIVNGQERLKPEYVGSKKSSLDDSKYVQIHVVFEDTKQPIGSDYFGKIDVVCEAVTFSCGS